MMINVETRPAPEELEEKERRDFLKIRVFELNLSEMLEMKILH